MTMLLNLPPSLEAQVQSEAARRQISPEDYMIELLRRTQDPSIDSDRRMHSLALLRSVADIGDDAELRETFAYLQQTVDADRLS